MSAGSPRRRRATVVTIAGIVAIVTGAGLAAAAGVLSRPASSTDRGTGVLGPAVAGAVTGLAVGAVVVVGFSGLAAIRRVGVATTLVVAAGLGAMVSVGATNPEPPLDIPRDEAREPTAEPGTPGGPGPIRDDREAADRGLRVGDLEGSLVLLLGLAGLGAAAVFFARRSELRPVERSAVYLASELRLTDDEEGEPASDPAQVADALERTLAALLDHDDPRLAIRAAYGTLLHELATVGAARRHYEGPLEHLRRCLGAVEIPAAPVTELVALFEIARFSDHPVSGADAARARAALGACITHLRPTVDARSGA